jgi:phosphoribosylformylglycinamidine synthase
VLIQTRLLLGESAGQRATLAWNRSGKFEDRWVHLETEGTKCVFLAGIETMYLPVAHGEGRFAASSSAVLDELDSAGQLVLRYASAPVGNAVRGVLSQTPNDSPVGSDPSPLVPHHSPLISYPANPNGAERNIAGICDSTGRVFGLMPHPERHVDPTQHPRWTRGESKTPGDGLQLFENAVAYFR